MYKFIIPLLSGKIWSSFCIQSSMLNPRLLINYSKNFDSVACIGPILALLNSGLV